VRCSRALWSRSTAWARLSLCSRIAAFVPSMSGRA
jgi:hypothetical protein